MKKFIGLIFSVLLSFTLSVYAKDVRPIDVSLNQSRVFGLYQIGNDVTIYSEPDVNSNILYRVRWNNLEFFPSQIGAENFFMVYMENKDLALVSVTEYEDDWLEIEYDLKNGKTGWIKLDDPYKFMTWVNFYNTYGKKYGLAILRGAPESVKDIKASPDESSKTLGVINQPQKINLNAIRGNWALVSVMDLDKIPKTGYVRWRSEEGVRYYFPAVK